MQNGLVLCILIHVSVQLPNEFPRSRRLYSRRSATEDGCLLFRSQPSGRALKRPFSPLQPSDLSTSRYRKGFTELDLEGSPNAIMSNQAANTRIHPVTKSGRTWSHKKQAQMSSPPPPKIKTVKQQVAAYEIDWVDLKAFLEKRFSKDKFPGVSSDLLVEDKSEDKFHLELPEALTPADHAEIKKLKRSNKAPAQVVQRAVTPD